MSHTSRSERRAFSRDGARHFAQPNPTGGPNRKVRRKQGERGTVSAIVHGPQDRAFLYSGTINGGGQARIDAKRNARAEFWVDFLKLRGSVEALQRLKHGVLTLNEYRALLGLPHLLNTDLPITLIP